jgi:hypothetical protein
MVGSENKLEGETLFVLVLIGKRDVSLDLLIENTFCSDFSACFYV